MVSVQQALALVQKHSRTTQDTETLALDVAIDRILAETIYSPIDMPPFRQSAMDGYALYLGDSDTYRLISEIKAGDSQIPKLERGEAVRIFTGAAVPPTANAVVMQEKVNQNGDEIVVNISCSIGLNIRPIGEQIKKEALALDKGTVLNAASIGFLATLGISKVKVFAQPRIAIMVTGSELIAPSQPLTHGKIYESNGVMLYSALKNMRYKNVSLSKVADDFEQTKDCLQKAITANDVVIVSGGISVGDYDFVGKSLEELGVAPFFYKVKQKPGKPLFFGAIAQTFIFALPGNPAATLTCFYVYVYPLLRRWEGGVTTSLQRIKLPSLSDFDKKGDRAQFLKAQIKPNGVVILEGQSSAMLHTYACSNALVYVPEDQMKIKQGDTVEVIILPNS